MHHIDNELVHQKNAILEKINNGEYEAAAMLIAFCAELWSAASYAYKTRELKDRLLQTLGRLIFDAEHHKTEQKLEALRAKCDSILQGRVPHPAL